ncbi:hypothetical protein KP509_32G049900 [Ceratopteris richardii]|uniref:Fatty acid hydroxylase domain-containing protein n=1 Tax=Ceratopteris richardii TaxID=49495 RepID=A0A8T2QUR7_CERRI|nr:hypothetical protein KP509_32G049900 [Ceratopteris richardii]
MAVSIASWPWERMGNYKYALYLPLVFEAYRATVPLRQNVCLHILIVTVLRVGVYQMWQMASRFLPLVEGLRIWPQGLSYRQVDREYDCDNPQLLQALLLHAGYKCFGLFENMPFWSTKGLIVILMLHVGPAEMFYYLIHRALHRPYFFNKYHKLHHESVSPEPSTAGVSSFLEQIWMSMVVGIAIVGSAVLGGASLFNLYTYLLIFECLRCYGHSGIEIIPASLFKTFPYLRYLLYTPSYHALHHACQDSNYCLFIPLYDYIGNTLNSRTKAFHVESRNHVTARVPDFIFLLHPVDFTSALHAWFLFRAYASRPYTLNIFLLPFVPLVVVAAFAFLIWGKVFRSWNYYIRNNYLQVWTVPRFGFMYFLPLARNNINSLIEKAILDADNIGVKVFSLAALNKNEALNGGGSLFVTKYPNLRIRVCHGNTLTAAVIIKEIPVHVKEVFLTGATSKLGRAIALYLCRMQIRVLMLTASRKRFEAIAAEAPPNVRNNLVQVTKYQAGMSCKVNIFSSNSSLFEGN